MIKYDLVVIGGGPGGYVSALHAAETGKKIALIEADFVGGTCLNRGCIPSKTYLKHSEVIEQIKKAKEWGIETESLTFSFPKLKKRKDDVIQRLRRGISYLLKEGKIDVYQGYGYIQPNGSVRVQETENEKNLQAEKIIVATGSMPAVPPIEGLSEVSYETSDTIFDLTKIPESLIIIGGGVIGVELATIFASLDTKVTIIESAEMILPSEDQEAASYLKRELEKKNINIRTNTPVKKVEEINNNKKVHCESNGQSIQFDASHILVCTGRRPNMSAVNEIGLDTDGPFIKVNKKMETSMPNVYAIGDVIGGYQLAHAASAEGIVAVNNAFGGNEMMNNHVMPRCVYTKPEIAAVGLNEEEAKKKGLDFEVVKYDFVKSGKAWSSGAPEGFTKIIVDKKYGEILGTVMVGEHVTEMISEASAFMYLEGTIEEAAKMIHPHPTISETFNEAAQEAVRILKH
ncbi:dihydrolipoyl dehydrogenase [Cytobacillus gottheilii]|uniref:dihydrolipoyl dehydrogenase n=1 Tax=Cytobacillus gottheilii TaxID=859144 RepID=UPI00082E446C|nr:dihydrolipoyl dehydrogenase [Cytobacillus gottheilii]